MQPQTATMGFPGMNPIDRYRIAAAEQISRITGADFDLVFNSLHRTSDLEHGDLGLALPRLRIKEPRPEELAKKIVDEACKTILPHRIMASRY
jgi:arginyl-tRNA synthetase